MELSVITQYVPREGRIETEQIKKKEAMKEKSKRGGREGVASVLSHGLQLWSSCCCGVGVSLCAGREGNDRGCLFPG